MDTGTQLTWPARGCEERVVGVDECRGRGRGHAGEGQEGKGSVSNCSKTAADHFGGRGDMEETWRR